MLSLEVSRKLVTAMRHWNEWVDSLPPEALIKDETLLEEIDNNENGYEETMALNMMEEAFIEFNFALKLLIGRLNVNFKLPPNIVDFANKFDEKLTKFAEMIQTSLETGEPIKELRKEAFILFNYLNALIPIVLTAHPK